MTLAPKPRASLLGLLADDEAVAAAAEALLERADLLKDAAARAACELEPGDDPTLVLDTLAKAGRIASFGKALRHDAPYIAAQARDAEHAAARDGIDRAIAAGIPTAADDPVAAALGLDERIAARANLARRPAGTYPTNTPPAVPPATPGRPFVLDPAATAAALDAAELADSPQDRARAAQLAELDAHRDSINGADPLEPGITRARPLPTGRPTAPWLTPPAPLLPDPAALAGRPEAPDLTADTPPDPLGVRLRDTTWPTPSDARHADLPPRPTATDDQETAEALNVLAHIGEEAPPQAPSESRQ